MRCYNANEYVHIVEDDNGNCKEELHDFYLGACKKCHALFVDYDARNEFKYVARPNHTETANRAGAIHKKVTNEKKLVDCHMEKVPCRTKSGDFDGKHAKYYPYSHTMHLRIMLQKGSDGSSMSLRPHIFVNDVCAACGERRTFDSSHTCLVRDANVLTVMESIDSQADMMLSCMYAGKVKDAIVACRFHMRGIQEMDRLEEEHYKAKKREAEEKRIAKAGRGKKGSTAHYDEDDDLFSAVEDREAVDESNTVDENGAAREGDAAEFEGDAEEA